MFGADYSKGRMVTGVSLSHSRGLGSYAGADSGQVTSAVTRLYPWIGFKPSERVTVWRVAGYGAGGLILQPGEGTPIETGLSMAMAAGGGRRELVATDGRLRAGVQGRRPVGRHPDGRGQRAGREPRVHPGGRQRTPRVGVRTSQYGRDYRFGYGMQVLEEGPPRLELGIEAERRVSPVFGFGQGLVENGRADQRVVGQASVEW